MTTTARPDRLTLQRGPFRVVWYGGEYADVTAPGLGAIDTVNMTGPDGAIPAMSREALRSAIDDDDVATWRETAREMRRFPVAGAL